MTLLVINSLFLSNEVLSFIYEGYFHWVENSILVVVFLQHLKDWFWTLLFQLISQLLVLLLHFKGNMSFSQIFSEYLQLLFDLQLLLWWFNFLCIAVMEVCRALQIHVLVIFRNNISLNITSAPVMSFLFENLNLPVLDLFLYISAHFSGEHPPFSQQLQKKKTLSIYRCFFQWLCSLSSR